MTGLNAARHRVTTWTLRKDFSYDQPHSTLEPPKWDINGLCPVAGVEGSCYAKTFPMFLQKAGYRTIHGGKAHWGAQDTPGADPKKLGFDVNIVGYYAGGVGSHYARKNFSAPGEPIWDVPGLEAYHGQEIYLTEVLTREANKQIDKAVKDNQPFYLNLSHYATHAPFVTDDRFSTNYENAGLTGNELAYATMIEGVDKSLGEILANISRHGIEEETIVVFMTDNGSPPPMPANRPLRVRKLSAYEGGPARPPDRKMARCDQIGLCMRWLYDRRRCLPHFSGNGGR